MLPRWIVLGLAGACLAVGLLIGFGAGLLVGAARTASAVPGQDGSTSSPWQRLTGTDIDPIINHEWWAKKPSREQVEKILTWIQNAPNASTLWVTKDGEASSALKSGYGLYIRNKAILIGIAGERRHFYTRSEAIEKVIKELDHGRTREGRL